MTIFKLLKLLKICELHILSLEHRPSSNDLKGLNTLARGYFGFYEWPLIWKNNFDIDFLNKNGEGKEIQLVKAFIFLALHLQPFQRPVF
jgi:hypothetical protein